MIKRYFVTGTDTEVGKTVTSVALLQAAKQHGYITAGYKPIASGSKLFSEGLRNSDVLSLQRNSSLKLSYQEVNVYTFAESTSPHILSTEERRPINFPILSEKLRALEDKANWILIEGAGGWFTPLSEQYAFSDWVVYECLPIILVVGIKLGCINHAMLTAQAIKHAGLSLVGWVSNDIKQIEKRRNEYITTLKHLLPAPLLGEIPWIGEEIHSTYLDLSRYIDMNVLNTYISTLSSF